MGGAASQHENELVLDVLGLSEPAFAVNGSHRIVAWNDGAERLLGLRAEDVIGRRCFEALEIGDNTLCMACRYFASAQPAGVNPAISALARHHLSFTIPVAVEGASRRVQVTTLAAHTRAGQARFVHLLQHATDDAAAEPMRSSPQHERPPMPLSEPAESGSKLRRPEALTQRELEVLRLLGAGYSTDDIARSLSITRVTARNHVNKVLDKLGVNSRLQAVVIASQLQLI
ncbi:MAG: LuxR C-terminal-related transcriptional regulator [Ktedonobacterales bacterium]